MSVYTFLGFNYYENGKKNYEGGTVSAARLFAHCSGVETTWNHRRFDGSEGEKFEPNTHFVFDENFKIVRIKEEDIPAEIEKVRQWQEERRLEALRIREANIATGRFIYEEHPDTYRPGTVWQIQREIISEKPAEFKEVALAELKKQWSFAFNHERISKALEKFIANAQEGDRLELVNAYRDPMAASTDFSIVRDGKPINRFNISVS